MATSKTSRPNQIGNLYSPVDTTSVSRVSRILDDTERASNVALGAAAIAILALFLFSFPLFDMYLTVNRQPKIEIVYEKKIEKLENRVEELSKQLKEREKEKQDE